jgi:hypothetical protein
MLYHYTSAKLLEKIIASGKLRPSDARGWRLLWATSAETIDLTSAYCHEPIVARFTLHSRDFEPWMDVRSRYQQKKRKRAELMEQVALKTFGVVRPQDWYVRAAALPADRWLRIDVRDQRWAPYISSTWQQPGPPQLGKMPGFSDWDYKIWGIDVGLDPDSMDDDGLADYRYLTKRDEDEDEVEVEDGNDTKKRMQEDAFTDDEQT